MMQDNLTNPFQIIKTKAREGWTGFIEVSEPQDVSISWRIYMLAGKVQYATSSRGQQERLNCLWQQFKLGLKCPTLVKHHSEYQQLCQWLSKMQATDFERSHLLSQFVREALIQVYSIEQTAVRLVAKEYLKIAERGFAINNLEVSAEGDRWRKIRTYFNSPFNRLYLEPSKALQFYKIWKDLYKLPEFEELANSLKLSSFVNLFTYKSCFYHLAARTNCEPLQLAEHLKSCIEKQILTILPYETISTSTPSKPNTKKSPKSNPNRSNFNRASVKAEAKVTPATTDLKEASERPVIACIDDSKTVQRQVKMTLEAIGYQIVSIYEPAQALKYLLTQQPVLILMDINMPHINGYDLCSMLRKSNRFNDIPIVMLTGRDGAIDRMRAKFVGSTDYMTKPFRPEKLVEKVQKFHRFPLQIQ